MKKRLILVFALLILFFVLSVCLDFIGLPGKSVTVSVPTGSGASQIASILKEENVIRFPMLFTQYARKDAAHLRAGVHTFQKNMGYKKALEELCRDVPLADTITVTIPEGYEVREIAALLESEGVVNADAFLDAAKEAHMRFSFLPKDGNVEGYLFPDTYQFLASSSAVSVLDSFLSTFLEKMHTEEILARCEELSLSFHEALTMASIIEREAAKGDERPIVASVFYNRLEKICGSNPAPRCSTFWKNENPFYQTVTQRLIRHITHIYMQGFRPRLLLRRARQACRRRCILRTRNTFSSWLMVAADTLSRKHFQSILRHNEKRLYNSVQPFKYFCLNYTLCHHGICNL